MFKAIEVSTELNLEQFSRLLWQRKISHRVHMLTNSQVLAVPKAEDVANVLELYGQWNSGRISPDTQDSADLTAYFSPSEYIKKSLLAFFRAPLTLSVIMVCVVLALVAPLDSNAGIVGQLLFPDFSFGSRTLNFPLILENFTLGQFINMITPILLHGGMLHLIFNMLWLWEFGKRIEAVQPWWMMLILIVVLALVSNTAQYIYSGHNRFGGMSGVVYGLFSYIWMWQLFDPRLRLNLPGSLIFFMLLSLGIMTYIGFEGIADQAHIGGLLCGVVLGAVLATVSKIRRSMKNTGMPQ